MKGLELPINIIVIIVLAAVVLIAGLFLFMGSWQTSGGATQSESIFRSLCNQLLQKNCNADLNSIKVTISGKDYTLASECINRGAKIASSVVDADKCKQLCGCLVSDTGQVKCTGCGQGIQYGCLSNQIFCWREYADGSQKNLGCYSCS